MRTISSEKSVPLNHLGRRQDAIGVTVWLEVPESWGEERGGNGVTANITQQFWATSRWTGARSSEEVMETPRQEQEPASDTSQV